MGWFTNKVTNKDISYKKVPIETARLIVNLGTACNIMKDWALQDEENRDFFIDCLVQNCKKFWELSGINKTVTREIVLKEIGL